MPNRSITILINNLGIGGAERLVVDEANELNRQGVVVTLVTLGPESQHSYHAQCGLLPQQVLYIPFASVFDLSAYRALISVLRARKASPVVTHLWFANTVGRIAAFYAGVRTVISFEHNVYDRVKTPKQFLVDWVLQWFTTRVIAVSSPVRDSLVRHGISPRKITVIENGIDLSRYADAAPAQIRSELFISNAVLYLFVGRLIEQKGVDVLLKAFAKSEAGYLLIVGDGLEGDSLRALAAELHVEHRVAFLGIRNDVPALMKAADVFVLPSRWEGLPLVVPEALSAGLPVIVSDFPAALDIVTHGRNGLICRRDDVDDLAAAIRQMGQAVLRRAMASVAPASASRFSIQRHIAKLLSYVR